MTSKVFLWNVESRGVLAREDQVPPSNRGAASPGQGQGRSASTLNHKVPKPFDVDEGHGSQPPETPKGLSKGGLCEASRRLFEHRQFQGGAIHRGSGRPVEELGRDFSQRCVLFGKCPGGAPQGFGDIRIEVARDPGQKLMPDPVPEERRVVVCRVEAARESVRAQMSEYGAPRHVEQRAEEFPIPRSHGGKAQGAAATNEAHEHRLCLVVERMSEDDGESILLTRDPPQEGVADQARGLFDAAVPERPLTRPRLSETQANLESIAQLFAESGVVPGVGAKRVVQVGCHDVQACLSPRPIQRIEQGD